MFSDLSFKKHQICSIIAVPISYKAIKLLNFECVDYFNIIFVDRLLQKDLLVDTKHLFFELDSILIHFVVATGSSAIDKPINSYCQIYSTAKNVLATDSMIAMLHANNSHVDEYIELKTFNINNKFITLKYLNLELLFEI